MSVFDVYYKTGLEDDQEGDAYSNRLLGLAEVSFNGEFDTDLSHWWALVFLFEVFNSNTIVICKIKNYK